MRIFVSTTLFLILALAPLTSFADSDFIRGTVESIEKTINPTTINPEPIYWAQVRTKTGVVRAENELGVVSTGDKVMLRVEQVPSETGPGNTTVYSIYERDRLKPLTLLVILFALSVLLLGVSQGLRALSALVGTLFVIFGIYIPSLLAGFSPVITSIILGLLVAGCAVFATHGFRRTTLLAYSSTLISVGLAVFIAYITIRASQLTGVTGDDVIFLASTSARHLDLAGIMIGGVIITMLGILDDIAITQVAVVEELKKSKPGSTFGELYSSALRIGRDHAGALVNTLVLAYAGASLPLLMLLQSQKLGLAITLNQEQFAFEIIRSLSGSIGLVACVPIATLLAIKYAKSCKHKHTHDGCPHCMSKISGVRN